ncbi:MAG: type VI secretion system accessory protein TagJ [Novosphingobium sp.]
MADADALLREGDVAGARGALTDIVRSRPSDPQARMFLFQLLAIAGEWDKARKALQALTQLEAEAQMLAMAYNQAIDGEELRARVFAGAAEMPLLANPEGWAAGVARGLTLFARGDEAGAVAARDAAFDVAPDMPCRLNGEPAEWIADGDSRFGPTLEVIVAGRYGLLPFDAVEKITSEGPRDLRDLVWYPVEIAMRSGQSLAAFLPTRYPGSERSTNGAEQLARVTRWDDAEWGQRGLGQRVWVRDDGEDCGVLSLRTLEFA